jgi:predicted RND superfamily exporter protein
VIFFSTKGIGIDDTFVMLASWRRTSPHDPVPKRMGETYAEAAVSITITSITDMLSFWVGVITPFPCVQIFSIYSGAAVVATYIWHIFFFGGAIALSGYHEADNRHSLVWWKKATPRSKVCM